MASETRHPQLVAAEQWARANPSLLSRTFERFQEKAQWPTLETLQLDFARGGQDIDVRALAFEMPPTLGGVEQQRLVLRIRALQFLPAAAPLLATWFSSLRLANRRWLSEGEDARLTGEDVLQVAHGDEDLALITSHFLLGDRWGLGGGHGLPADPNWSADIVSEVRFVRDTHSAGDLLAVRDRREYPEGEGAGPALPSDSPPPAPQASPGRWKRLSSWAVEHYLGAVAAGLTVALVGVAVAWAVSNISGDNGDPEISSGVSGESTELHPQGAEGGEPKGVTEEAGEAGEAGARTYRNPLTLSQTGPSLPPSQQVKVACRVYAPTMPSVKPDGYWYRILSAPWNGNYYAPANSFMNGDSPGQTSNIHNTDFDVHVCAHLP